MLSTVITQTIKVLVADIAVKIMPPHIIFASIPASFIDLISDKQPKKAQFYITGNTCKCMI